MSRSVLIKYWRGMVHKRMVVAQLLPAIRTVLAGKSYPELLD